jgi:hypothetical protein
VEDVELRELHWFARIAKELNYVMIVPHNNMRWVFIKLIEFARFLV